MYSPDHNNWANMGLMTLSYSLEKKESFNVGSSEVG